MCAAQTTGAPERRVDHEAEVGVVVVRRASRVPREGALDYVFCYVPLLDITLQMEEDPSIRKSYEAFTAIDPRHRTADAPERSDIGFRPSARRHRRQKLTTRHLMLDTPRLIEVYTEAMTLGPSELIASGAQWKGTAWISRFRRQHRRLGFGYSNREHPPTPYARGNSQMMSRHGIGSAKGPGCGPSTWAGG
jgi:2-keto-4-pentenoate hydratase/2-oxohepta-3-ene-1,7-dioic acid hydratase in catechol pathway